MLFLGDCIGSVRRTRSLVVRTFTRVFIEQQSMSRSNDFHTCLCGATEHLTKGTVGGREMCVKLRRLPFRLPKRTLTRADLFRGRQGGRLCRTVRRLGPRCRRTLCLICFRSVDCRNATRIVNESRDRVGGLIREKGGDLGRLLKGGKFRC